MALNTEAFRCKVGQVARTVVHIEDALAIIALEVVMVRMHCGLIASAVAGQGNGIDVAFFKQTFQIPIDGGLAKAWRLRFRSFQDFLGR